MPQTTRWWSKRLTLCAIILLLACVVVVPTRGQEPLPQLFITGNDVTSPPNFVLHVYGRDAQGQPLELTDGALVVTHEGATVPAEIAGAYPGGTFTIFLVDIPTGVTEQIPAIQDAIRQFASPTGGMQEQVDYMAIYKVGEAEARELLAPTNFYNAVQNFFVDGLQPEIETTALIDSLYNLLDQVETLKPEQDVVTSIVVVSDGTDVVSTAHEGSDVLARAAELNVPVHTIWVNSADLTLTGQEQGQAFLRDVANGTRGLATTLDNAEGLSQIWNRIAGFREQARVRYEAPELAGGSYEVQVSLAADPVVSASTTVTMPENQPAVLMEIPEESREMSLPNLEEPVRLGLGATVYWLDGVERELASAVLRINGRDVAAIPVDQIGEFTAEISDLSYGSNSFEIVVEDVQNLRAVSPPVVINVSEGPRDIPGALQPSGGLGTVVRNVLLFLLVLVVLGVLLFFLARRGLLSNLVPRGRSRSRRRAPVTYSTEVPPVPTDGETANGSFLMAHLEVLQAESEMPERISLDEPVVRIGRSPVQSNVAFREDITVSRLHASLHLEGNHYRIFDERSTSGTFVNGRAVPEYGAQLADGDEITLGAVQLRFRQL